MIVVSRRSGNPATRGARFPFVVDCRDDRGWWIEQGGRNTLEEAEAWVAAFRANGGEARVRATTTAALAVECPQCGAQPGEHCWSGTRRFRQLVRGAHQPRVRLASGEDVKPSFETILRRELRKVEAEVLSDRRSK